MWRLLLATAAVLACAADGRSQGCTGGSAGVTGFADVNGRQYQFSARPIYLGSWYGPPPASTYDYGGYPVQAPASSTYGIDPRLLSQGYGGGYAGGYGASPYGASPYGDYSFSGPFGGQGSIQTYGSPGGGAPFAATAQFTRPPAYGYPSPYVSTSSFCPPGR